MEFLRIVTATISFIAGTILIVGMFTPQSDWADLLAGFLFYLFSYSTWPSKKRGKRESESPLLDILEFIVEFPIETIIWFVRLCFRLLRSLSTGKNDGIDFDL